METKEYFSYRKELLNNSVYPDGGGYADSLLLDNVLSDLLETKLIDSEDINNCFYNSSLDGVFLKVDAYCMNETGERLQLFLINENATSQATKEEDLVISTKAEYDDIFNKTNNFLKKSIKRHLELQDSDPAYFILEQLKSSDFIDKIDVVEIFLISPTLTVTMKNEQIIGLKKIEFRDKEMKTSFQKGNKREEKSILLTYTLIDLNFLYNVSLSKGNEYALEINIEEVFGSKIEVLKAAETADFESYLCVLPADGIASLYRRYSTRLLEKNVRSFLQFRGVNGGMRKTIRETPEKFIAYNNGLTITATDRNLVEDNGKLFLKSLTDFQIVNGGQTTASIFFSKKDNLDISEINLMAKINIAKNLNEEDLNTLISNISLYSNSQSKVSRVDLRSRDPKMDRIKKLSDTVLTPTGGKWFFEKSKGEFATRKRLTGGKIEKDYPRKVRLSKTDIGKYHTAWGDQPWLVKKGGEKVFRTFMENLNGEGIRSNELEIDRAFYEDLIAKTILFKGMEDIHGTRGNAIGQLRAAVVPYSISVLYNMFGGSEKRDAKFDLVKLWKSQEIDDSLKVFLKSLMKEMYVLIEKYKSSTDISENTKKKELWESIKKSKELKEFIKSPNALFIIDNYKLRTTRNNKNKEVDFSKLNDIVELFSKTKPYYFRLETFLIKYNANIEDPISYSQKLFSLYVDELFSSKKISDRGIKFFNDLFLAIRIKANSIFDEIKIEPDLSIITSLDKIMTIYGNILRDNKDVEAVFNGHEKIAINKGLKYTSSISQIGKSLARGECPDFKYINLATAYFSQ
ncbi:AIPR family protein [Polaribacter sp. PL03]|uniref:AIPR family protein n=1 Tax=Polaribacter sp. PL03 TaxID=3088353 RepID=UPI0029CE19B5|nr:AIPR family protein [Polaribacter sp. PL03]MDX6746830.1 AIPR family protein [Polaribacter sp. PL03]